MPLQWHYQSRTDLGILALAGRLGIEDVPLLRGAIGWTVYHGAGPVILDLSALTGWTGPGRAAIGESAARLATARRRLEVAGVPAGQPGLVTGADQPAIPVHADVLSALTAHRTTVEATGEIREWRSAGWPEPGELAGQAGQAGHAGQASQAGEAGQAIPWRPHSNDSGSRSGTGVRST